MAATNEGVACWLVRAGERGEHLGTLAELGLLTISWGSIPGLGDPRDHPEEDIRNLLLQAGRGQPKSDMDELFGFRDDMIVGDFVVSPEKPVRDRFAIGRVTGEYRYSDEPIVGDHHHVRPVKWLGWRRRSELPEHLAKAFEWRRTVRPLPEQTDWLAFLHAVVGGSDALPVPRDLPVRPQPGQTKSPRRVVVPHRQCPSCGLVRSPAMFENEDDVCRDCA